MPHGTAKNFIFGARNINLNENMALPGFEGDS